MKQLYRTLLIAILFTGFYTSNVFASHIVGADLSYKCLGGLNYEFTLTFYRDCNGIDAPTSIPLTLISNNGGYNSSLTLFQISEQEISPICPADLSMSVCNGGTLPGVQQFVYQGTIALPAYESDWIFYYEDCCRNAAITNIYNAANYGIRITDSLDNSAGIQVNSPIFSNPPVPFVCNMEPFNYNHGGYDPDGDSLNYQLVSPEDYITGAAIPYISPFSPTYPLSTVSGTVGFSSTTGQLTFTPNATQITITAIRAYQYRSGACIGYVTRDIEVFVNSCTNTSPFASSLQNLMGGASTGPNSFTLCANTPASFQITVQDSDIPLQSIIVSSNANAVLPGSAFTSTGTNPVVSTFTWTPTNNDTGFHNFTITYNDQNCPIEGISIYSYQIYVSPAALAGPDLYGCYPDTFQLNGSGGSSFSWSPSSGLNNPNIPNPIASPSITTTYILTTNLNNACKNKDTMTVYVGYPYGIQASATPKQVCAGTPINLTSTITGGAGSGYQYDWKSYPPRFTSATADPTDTPTVTTTYFIFSQNGGCHDSASVKVIVDNTANSSFLVSPDTSCQTDLIFISYLGNTGDTSNFIWKYSGANILAGSGRGPFTLNYAKPGLDTISLEVTNPDGCNSNTTRDVMIVPAPNDTFAASPRQGCEPLTVDFTVPSTAGATYNWSFGDGGSSTLQDPSHIYTSGIYNVSLTVSTSNGGCTATYEIPQYISVGVPGTPNFSVSPDTGKIADIGQTYTFTNTSQLADSYTWNFGDGSTSNKVNPTHVYTTAGNYTVILVACDNEGCCDSIEIGFLHVTDLNDFWAPTGFSPEAMANNRFHILGYNLSNADLRVYNRWGQKVWEGVGSNATDAGSGWDGTFKGNKCGIGTYSWYATATLANGSTITKKGNVTLIR